MYRKHACISRRLIALSCCKETSSDLLCGFFAFVVPTLIYEASAAITREKGEGHKMYDLFCLASTEWIRHVPLQTVDDIVAM